MKFVAERTGIIGFFVNIIVSLALAVVAASTTRVYIFVRQTSPYMEKVQFAVGIMVAAPRPR